MLERRDNIDFGLILDKLCEKTERNKDCVSTRDYLCCVCNHRIKKRVFHIHPSKVSRRVPESERIVGSDGAYLPGKEPIFEAIVVSSSLARIQSIRK